MISLPAYASDTGLLPYKIEAPRDSFSRDLGMTYARYVHLAARIIKGIEMVSPLDMAHSLRRIGKDSQQSITAGDLSLMGKNTGIDYIILGTLKYTGKRYVVKSLRYSLRDRQVVDRFELESEELIDLANREVKRVFLNRPDRTFATGGAKVDTVFLMEATNSLRPAWNTIQQGIVDYAGSLSSSGVSFRIYCIPLSSRWSSTRTVLAEGSPVEIRKWFKGLDPAGTLSAEIVDSGLKYATGSLRLRRDSKKRYVMIVKNPPSQLTYSHYSSRIRREGAELDLVYLKGKAGSGPLDRLALSTGGSVRYAAWHQVAYDLQGRPRHLYLQEGRLFETPERYPTWERGLLKGDGRYRPARSGLEEVDLTGKERIRPGEMASLYQRVTGNRFLRSERPDCNVDHIISAYHAGSTGPVAKGRVLLSDGQVSIWHVCRSRDEWKFFSSRDGFFYVPARIVARKGESYGFILQPLLMSLRSTEVPGALNPSLSEVSKNLSYHVTHGIGEPPHWVFRLKVVRREEGSAKDIRDF
jgi:hypothetical protein